MESESSHVNTILVGSPVKENRGTLAQVVIARLLEDKKKKSIESILTARFGSDW